MANRAVELGPWKALPESLRVLRWQTPQGIQIRLGFAEHFSRFFLDPQRPRDLIVPSPRKVFTDLPKDVQLQKKTTEISAIFAAIGALLAAAAIVASIRWSPYP